MGKFFEYTKSKKRFIFKNSWIKYLIRIINYFYVGKYTNLFQKHLIIRFKKNSNQIISNSKKEI